MLGRCGPRAHIPGKPLAGCMTLSKSPTIPSCFPFTQLSDSHDYLEECGEGPRSTDVTFLVALYIRPSLFLSCHSQSHRAPNAIRPNGAPI